MLSQVLQIRSVDQAYVTSIILPLSTIIGLTINSRSNMDQLEWRIYLLGAPGKQAFFLCCGNY